MRVRQGWSGEVKPNVWVKFDVELEEEDLRRLLTDAGIDKEASVTLPLMMVYALMEIEAERLVTIKLVTRYGFSPADGTTKVGELNQAKSAVLTKMRAIAP